MYRWTEGGRDVDECIGQGWAQRGRRERERAERSKFTHMVLVSGLPLGTMWSGTNFTFHSLKAFLRHFYPPLKGHKWMEHTLYN